MSHDNIVFIQYGVYENDGSISVPVITVAESAHKVFESCLGFLEAQFKITRKRFAYIVKIAVYGIFGKKGRG